MEQAEVISVETIRLEIVNNELNPEHPLIALAEQKGNAKASCFVAKTMDDFIIDGKVYPGKEYVLCYLTSIDKVVWYAVPRDFFNAMFKPVSSKKK